MLSTLLKHSLSFGICLPSNSDVMSQDFMYGTEKRLFFIALYCLKIALHAYINAKNSLCFVSYFSYLISLCLILHPKFMSTQSAWQRNSYSLTPLRLLVTASCRILQLIWAKHFWHSAWDLLPQISPCAGLFNNDHIMGPTEKWSEKGYFVTNSFEWEGQTGHSCIYCRKNHFASSE